MLSLVAGLPWLKAAAAVAGRREDFAAALDRHPELIGFATARAETFAADLRTESGSLPRDLAGVLWRNGPGEHERFGHRYGHWFDGDGLVQAFRFADGGVSHRARILDTPKRRRETQAGRRVMPAFATPGSQPPNGPDEMNAANTAMLSHSGRLMALWEGGSALALDPDSLAAQDFVAWRPDLAGLPFSAHPKQEPDGTLWNVGFVARPRPALLFYRIDRQGRLVKVAVADAGPLGMVHDFVVTARHLVVLLPPFLFEPDLESPHDFTFLGAHVWRPDLGTRVLVVDKDSLEPVRRHQLPAGFHFHHGNGWEEADGTIRLDLCQAPDPDFVTRDLRAVMRGETGFRSQHPRYRTVRLSPNGAASIETAGSGMTEFPRIDPRRTGRRHRMLFALTGDEGMPGWPFRAVSRLEPDRGETGRWRYPADRIPEEHVFVPRGGAEGDGWLIGPFLDVRRRVSGLAVFDAAHLSDGPLWQGLLPYPLPLGLHGSFVPV